MTTLQPRRLRTYSPCCRGKKIFLLQSVLIGWLSHTASYPKFTAGTFSELNAIVVWSWRHIAPSLTLGGAVPKLPYIYIYLEDVAQLIRGSFTLRVFVSTQPITTWPPKNSFSQFKQFFSCSWNLGLRYVANWQRSQQIYTVQLCVDLVFSTALLPFILFVYKSVSYLRSVSIQITKVTVMNP